MASSRKRDHLVARKISSVRDASLNVLGGQLREASDDLFVWQARSDVIQNHGHKNPGSRHAFLSVADIRIDADVVLPVHDRGHFNTRRYARSSAYTPAQSRSSGLTTGANSATTR